MLSSDDPEAELGSRHLTCSTQRMAEVVVHTWALQADWALQPLQRVHVPEQRREGSLRAVLGAPGVAVDHGLHPQAAGQCRGGVLFSHMPAALG